MSEGHDDGLVAVATLGLSERQDTFRELEESVGVPHVRGFFKELFEKVPWKLCEDVEKHRGGEVVMEMVVECLEDQWMRGRV